MLVPLAALQLAVLALFLPIVVPVRTTASMVTSGVWEDTFFKDEIGWPELAARPPSRGATPGADRAGAGRDRRGELRGGVRARAVRTRAGAAVGAGPDLELAVLAPRTLPQRYALFVGYKPD